ncbi:MAG: DUF1638 domain-containing protein [Gammaproteobacteria bacterium]|nr:MAG: DUF1638 domain-containing protein [Gammaproteobacteria bacterium]
MRAKILVIACGAIARELVRIKTLNQWHHIELQCLPAALHNTPDKIPAAVRAKIESQANRYEKVFIAFADCGTGGKLDSVLDEYGIERIPGTHCYEFYSGSEQFLQLARTEPGTFYLTDFLARHFERLVIGGLGLDRQPELLPLYFRNYTRVLYLAQTESEELQAMSRKHANYLGLEYEYCFTGDRPLSLVLEPALGKLTYDQEAIS